MTIVRKTAEGGEAWGNGDDDEEVPIGRGKGARHEPSLDELKRDLKRLREDKEREIRLREDAERKLKDREEETRDLRRRLARQGADEAGVEWKE